jgi:hypothetical protein
MRRRERRIIWTQHHEHDEEEAGDQRAGSLHADVIEDMDDVTRNQWSLW